MKSKQLLLILTTALFASLLTVSTSNFAADFTQSTPTEDFIDNKDGSVTHKKTGLTWQRCAVGQTWIGGDCDDTGSEVSFYDAMAVISKMPEKSGWRLPRIDELLTIVEYSSSFPAINKTIFPFTPIGYFWTSSISTNNTETGWLVDFQTGTSSLNELKSKKFIRLVQGENNLNKAKEYTPSVDFIDNKNGTVTHKKTGLTWQRCAVGQTWTGNNCGGSEREMDYYEAINQTSDFASHDDWRLPRISELLALVEYTNSKPAINNSLFPNTKNMFWSASNFDFHPAGIYSKNLTSYTNNAFVVAFSEKGEIGMPLKTDNRYAVRLIRGGNPLSLDLMKERKPSISDMKETKDERRKRELGESVNFGLYSADKRSEQINQSTKKLDTTEKNEKKISSSADLITQEIVQRCKTQMGEHGATMVKACVDQDLDALSGLNSLIDSHHEIATRCYTSMKRHGYAMVKACVDQDVAAEEALKRY